MTKQQFIMTVSRFHSLIVHHVDQSGGYAMLAKPSDARAIVNDAEVLSERHYDKSRIDYEMIRHGVGIADNAFNLLVSHNILFTVYGFNRPVPCNEVVIFDNRQIECYPLPGGYSSRVKFVKLHNGTGIVENGLLIGRVYMI